MNQAMAGFIIALCRKKHKGRFCEGLSIEPGGGLTGHPVFAIRHEC